MIDFVKAILKYRNEIKQIRKEEKIKTEKEREQKRIDEELSTAMSTLKKYINRNQYILIGKQVVKVGSFKCWTDVEKKITSLRLVKTSDKEARDWIKQLDKKFTKK